MSRQVELREYIRTLCLMYYNKKGTVYKDPSIRKLIDKAKEGLRQ